MFRTTLTETGTGTVRHPPPTELQGEVLRSFPKTDSQQVDLRAADLASLDLRPLAQELQFVQFDTRPLDV